MLMMPLKAAPHLTEQVFSPLAVDYADEVNPLVGTASSYELSSGNTYPAIAMPFGMNAWTPQTGKNGDGWTYQYAANKLRGIKQTHQPSPWINDYGAFALLPTTGGVVFDEEQRQTWFSHKSEVAHPYRYKVYLADYDTHVDLVPTERTALFSIRYPEGRTPRLVVDAYSGGSSIRVDAAHRRIYGYAGNNHGGVPQGFKNYFVIELDCAIDSTQLFLDNSPVTGTTTEGDHAGVVVTLAPQGHTVTARVASSFIGWDQALVSLQREQSSRTIDDLARLGKARWNEMLGRISVEGSTADNRRTFYTALYRTLLFPRAFHEVDARGDTIHYSPYNGQVLPGVLYTDNGFWDTFRAVFPLFTLVYPDMNRLMMRGLVNTYKESGWLPEWQSPGHRDCMIGSNSASIIADAWLKGIRGYDIATLYEALLKNSNHEGPLSSVGRKGADYYNRLGYVPYNVGINENAARTLEYAYDDFCLWRLSQALGKGNDHQRTFLRRAFNYRNVINPATGFARGRNLDGSFQIPFRPDKWGDAFTEGCAWHWTWCVFHDPEGLIRLLGGREAFCQRLDSVFVASPTFDDSYYGSQIHEITEMLVADMGQYAHGNQPIQHALHLYNWAGQPWKTQWHVREVMRRLYQNAPDGLCGDEDNGQTSAWYVFSALGFYPVAPATGQYAMGSPLFDKAQIHLPGGNTLTIEARDNAPHRVYVNSVRRNGTIYTRNYFDHSDLLTGGRIEFEMSEQPNLLRGTDKADVPYSLTSDQQNPKR